jgi:predicted amidohydrolase YtcJ
MVVGLVFWFLVGGLAFAQTPSLVPEAIFFNGKIVTVDSGFSIQQAIAIRGDRFWAVGSSAEVRALAGPATRLVDLQGRTVIPGLIDNHLHQYRAASTLLRGAEMAGAESLRELLDRLRKAVAAAKPGAPLLAGGGWDPREFPERRPPTRAELDQLAPNQPLLLIRSRSQIFLNTLALKAAGIDRNAEKITGIAVPKDARGEPTGEILEPSAVTEVTNKLLPPPNDEEKKELILRTQPMLNAAGLTSVRELSLTPDIMRVYGELRREKKLTVRVSMGIDTAATDADRLEEILQPWGVGPGFGDEWLRLDCVAEFAIDSGVETAYLRAPHLSERDNYLGEARLTPEKFREAVGVMHRYGWRPSIHLVGDRALDMALDAYEAADRVSSIRSRRWIVEHVPAIKPDQMERMARLGILVSAQIQPYLDGPAMIRDWGKERAERAVPVRAMLDHGLIVSSGTDWPGRSLSPFLSMYFYVTRKTADGTPLGVAERISRKEALKLATINNAYMTFEETTKGSIEPGKLADFLILSDDLLTVPEDQIRTVRTVATYVGGRKVFSTAEGNGY